MRQSTIPGSLFCLALCLVSPPLKAGIRSTQVVVLDTRTTGELRLEERARIGDALWAALDRLGIRRVADTDREAVLSGEEGLRACLTRDECQEKLGRLLEATHVIGIAVARTAPTAFRLELKLFDVDVGESGAEVNWSCTACGIEEVARQLDALVETAVQKDHERPRATLVVRSTPPNAEVRIDGRPVGFTELERHVFAGPHEIVASRLNMAPEHMRIDVNGEQRVSISFSLLPPMARKAVAVAPPPPEKPHSVIPGPGPEAPRSHWRLGVGIALMAVGAAVVGLGGVSLSANGQCVDQACNRRFDSQAAGGAEIGVGAAAIIGGLVLSITDRRGGQGNKRPGRLVLSRSF